MASQSSGYDRGQIEEIKQRLNIEDLVKEYVELKSVGRNLFGICPFHNEDTPSFSVNQELGIYKCFGCGESGDIIQFLMKIENLDFPEALEQLAKRAGVKLKTSKFDKRDSKKYTRAKEANKAASQYFHYILMKHNSGKNGRSYARRRKLTKSAIEDFKIGYAPDYKSTNSLSGYLQKQGFKADEIVEFGLAKKKDKRIIDKFYDRLMFSIFDTSGNVIGFSGRILDSSEKRPKYINTPETILFKKRRNLFGLYQAKKAIREKDFVILVEGQTDVISSWQAGIKNIVAPLGTSITDTQLEKIKRFTRNIAVSFDNDAAGFKARLRASEMAYKQGLNVEAIEIPKGKDADECIKINPKLWKTAVESRVPTITYLLGKMAKKYDLTSLDGKQRIIKFVIPLLSNIKDQIVQDHHIKEISKKSGISEKVLQNYIETPDKKKLLKAEVEKERKVHKADISKEIYLLSVITQYPRYIDNYQKEIESIEFQTKNLNKIFQVLVQSDKKKPEKIMKSLSPDQQIIYEDAKMRPIWNNEPAESKIDEEIADTLHYIKVRELQRKIKKAREEIGRLEELKKTADANKLNEKLKNLIDKLHKLKS